MRRRGEEVGVFGECKKTTMQHLTWIDCLVLFRSENSLIPNTENSSRNALLTRSLFSWRRVRVAKITEDLFNT